MCTDGSEKSRAAFGNISRIMDKEKDTMEILAVKTAGFDTSKLAEHCQAGFDKGNIKGKVTILENDPTKKIENIILEYIHDEKTQYVDFVSVRSELSSDRTIWGGLRNPQVARLHRKCRDGNNPPLEG